MSGVLLAGAAENSDPLHAMPEKVGDRRRGAWGGVEWSIVTRIWSETQMGMNTCGVRVIQYVPGLTWQTRPGPISALNLG